MSIEVYSFTALCPTLTHPQTNPVVISMRMPTRVVNQIEVRIPPGPNGEMGFAIAYANQAIIPYNPGEWVVTSDEVITWQLTGYPTSGAWQVKMYNTGNFDHAIQIRFYVDLVDAAGTSTTPTFIDGDTLSAGDSGSTATP